MAAMAVLLRPCHASGSSPEAAARVSSSTNSAACEQRVQGSVRKAAQESERAREEGVCKQVKSLLLAHFDEALGRQGGQLCCQCAQLLHSAHSGGGGPLPWPRGREARVQRQNLQHRGVQGFQTGADSLNRRKTETMGLKQSGPSFGWSIPYCRLDTRVAPWLRHSSGMHSWPHPGVLCRFSHTETVSSTTASVPSSSSRRSAANGSPANAAALHTCKGRPRGSQCSVERLPSLCFCRCSYEPPCQFWQNAWGPVNSSRTLSKAKAALHSAW
jgi:hypothetical protein